MRVSRLLDGRCLPQKEEIEQAPRLVLPATILPRLSRLISARLQFTKFLTHKLQPSAGYTFELQFHTPEGMAMKMGESHRLYEEVRSPKRTESERLEFYLQLKGLWDSLPVRRSTAVSSSL